MTEDGQLTYLNEKGEYKDDIYIKQGSEIYKQIKEAVNSAGKEQPTIKVIITSAMGESHVTAIKNDTTMNK